MVYEMAKKWRIDEGIKIFGCQNSKNSSLYNGKGEFKKYLAQNQKKSSLYSGRGIILKSFFEMGG